MSNRHETTDAPWWRAEDWNPSPSGCQDPGGPKRPPTGRVPAMRFEPAGVSSSEPSHPTRFQVGRVCQSRHSGADVGNDESRRYFGLSSLLSKDWLFDFTDANLSPPNLMKMPFRAPRMSSVVRLRFPTRKLSRLPSLIAKTRLVISSTCNSPAASSTAFAAWNT